MSTIPFNAAANLTADPEVRTTKAGKPVASMRLAINRRRIDSETGQWADAEPTFLTATVWGEQARHVGDSLRRSDRVIVIGQLVTRSWMEQGQKRTALEVVVDEIGPSIRWATAVITKPSAELDAAEGYDTDDRAEMLADQVAGRA